MALFFPILHKVPPHEQGIDDCQLDLHFTCQTGTLFFFPDGDEGGRSILSIEFSEFCIAHALVQNGTVVFIVWPPSISFPGVSTKEKARTYVRPIGKD
jgi:hypothetical protein